MLKINFLNDKKIIKGHWSELWILSGLLYIISGLIFIFISLNNTIGISLIVIGAYFYIIGRDTSSKNNKGEIIKNKKDDESNLFSTKVVLVCSIVVLFTSILGIGHYCYDSSYSRAYNKQMVLLELEQKKNDREYQIKLQKLKELKMQNFNL